MSLISSRFRTLVLDDDKSATEAIGEAIELLGGSVDAFNDPVECLEYLKTHRKDYKFVFVDLAMPVINGTEFLELASHHFVSSPKQFILTGLAEIDGAKVSSSLRYTVLQKPLKIRDLKDKISLV